MSAVMDTVRELVDKVPNLAELARQAKKGPEPPKETAWVYNGFDDIELKYLGAYRIFLPAGQVTEIRAIEHREPDASKSIGRQVVYQVLHLPGESIARELVETRGYRDRGIEVFLSKDVPEAARHALDERGKQYINTEIEAFKVNREKAKAGVPGFKIRPDANIYRWMRKYTPDDEIFADQSKRTDQQQTTAAVLEKITLMLDQLVREPKANEAVVQEAVKSISRKFTRKPTESEADYGRRLARMLAEEAAG